MSLLGPWLAFPAILVVLCLGSGLLVERAAGTRLPGQLLLPLGFAALVAITQLTTFKPATAPATIPVALAATLAGYALSRGRLRELRPQRWLVALALATFAIFGAPALLWGSPTFLGYGNLGDAAVHFGIVDLLLSHGHSTADLAASSLKSSIGEYFATAYPTGNHGVLAVARALGGQDVAWVFQPFLTMLAVFAALGLEQLARELTGDRRLSALAAGIAVHAALVYGYAVNQEAIKELGAIVLLVLLVALVAPLLRTPPGWRAAIPLAVATGGGLGVLSLALAPWLGPLLLAAAAALTARHWRLRRPALLLEVGVFVALATVLAIPRLAHLNTFVTVSKGVLTATQEFGNLQRELDFVTAFGVWPVDDFRSSAAPHGGVALALVGIAVLATLFGAIAVGRRGAWRPLLFAGISLVGFAVVARSASPWAYGKALMLLSPALALLGAAGAIGLLQARRRAEGTLLLAALVTGVLWSAALNYHGVDAAPHDRLDELSRIDQRFDGQGPALFVEFDEYAKHFLRDLAPTGATEAFRPAFPAAAEDADIRFGFSSDIEDWQPGSVARHFNLLVLRRGPTRSRPGTGWERVFEGRYYDVWRREHEPPTVLAELRLGDRLDAGAPARCRDLRRVAATAAATGGRLAFAAAPTVAAFRPTSIPAPRNWYVDGGDPEVYRPIGPGRVAGVVSVPRAGRYEVWLEASAQRAASVHVDDRYAGAVEDHLNPRLSATLVGTVGLAAGRHDVRIDLGGGELDPGNGGLNRMIGPVYLVPVAAAGEGGVQTLPAKRWRSLCGRKLDWVQAIT